MRFPSSSHPVVTLFFAATAASTLGACDAPQDDGGSYSIADEPLAGEINGEPFEFSFGETNAFLYDDEENEHFVVLYGQSVAGEAACGFFTNEGSEIIISVPNEPGDYELSLRNNGTFAFDDDGDIQNNVSTEGLLRVDEVTDTEIKGGLYMVYDDENAFEVSGEFTVTICMDDA